MTTENYASYHDRQQDSQRIVEVEDEYEDTYSKSNTNEDDASVSPSGLISQLVPDRTPEEDQCDAFELASENPSCQCDSGRSG